LESCGVQAISSTEIVRDWHLGENLAM
jgi:hypothetical protein